MAHIFTMVKLKESSQVAFSLQNLLKLVTESIPRDLDKDAAIGGPAHAWVLYIQLFQVNALSCAFNDFGIRRTVRVYFDCHSRVFRWPPPHISRQLEALPYTLIGPPSQKQAPSHSQRGLQV